MPKAVVDDSLSLYYHIRGKGPPIVFIHPPVMGHKVFKHQEELAEHYQLIFYDLPGHGQSSRGKNVLSISYLADNLRELLDILKMGKVAVCGFSHGTLIAQEFALKYPERTSALILCGGYPEVRTLNIKSLAAGGMVLAKLGQVPILAKIMAKTHRYFKRDEEELYKYSLKADPQKIYEYIKAGMEYNATAYLHLLTAPVLLVYGSLEKMNHRNCKVFERELPDSQTVYVKGATHQLPPRFFGTFNGIIRQFLEPLADRHKENCE